MSDTTHSAPGSGSPGSSQGGQQQSSATPTGGMPIEQIDRAQADRRENPNTRGISPARDQREAAAARAAGQQPSGEQQGNQQQQGSQPAAGGDEKIKFGDQELTVAELADLRKFKGEQDSRALTLPPTPEAYELKVPENFQLPAGVSKFEFNQNDPFLAQARQLAHRDKISQASFSEILGIYAGQRVAEATVINNARTAELAKLGGAATDRITAIRTFLHGTIGSDQAAAVEQMLCTSKQVEAFEKIINNFSRQGGTQFSQSGREPEQPAGKIPGYDKMSFEEKRMAQMKSNPPAQRTTRDIR